MDDSHGFKYAIFSYLSNVAGLQAYGLIFGVLFVCGIGVPIPEDITLISAGFLAAGDNISLAGAFIVGFVGVLVGDVLLFLIGRKYGRRVFKWPVANKIFTPSRVEKAEKRIQENARMICFSARFAPGLRSAIFLMCGVMGVKFRVFFIQDFLAAIISVPVWVYAGYWFGNNIDGALQFAKNLNYGIIAIFLVVAIGLVLRHYMKIKKRPST